MLWALLVVGTVWMFSRSSSATWNEAKAREAGCRLLAEWGDGAGAPVLGEPTPQVLGSMILAVLYGENASVPEQTQQRALLLADRLLREGC